MTDTQLLLDFVTLDRQIPLLSPDEIYANVSEHLLFRLNEDGRIEWKAAETQSDALARYFSMWANTAPAGGIIVLGVTDDRSIAGCSTISHERLMGHEKAGRELCPDARYDTKRIECARTKDGQPDFLLLIRVYYREDKVVEMHKGEAFFRRGNSCCKLSEEEKRELAIDKGQVSFEQEPCPGSPGTGICDVGC